MVVERRGCAIFSTGGLIAITPPFRFEHKRPFSPTARAAQTMADVGDVKIEQTDSLEDLRSVYADAKLMHEGALSLAKEARSRSYRKEALADLKEASVERGHMKAVKCATAKIKGTARLRRSQRLSIGTSLVLYHQTDKSAAKAILNAGVMRRGAKGLAGPAIYFASTPEGIALVLL
jgi:hypothetical protein